MYKSKKPYLYGTGRRKSSVARVRLYEGGTGKITINGRDIDDYFGLDTLKLITRQPLVLTEMVEKVDIIATVTGGGVTGHWRTASRYLPCPAAGQSRVPSRFEESWLPDPRPQNEGKKEVRSQSGETCSAVLQALIAACLEQKQLKSTETMWFRCFFRYKPFPFQCSR